MGNKLRDIFSDVPVDMGVNIRFKNEESYKDFLDSLKIVLEEGKGIKVDGVSSISTQMKSGKYAYPFITQNNIEKVIIAPCREKVKFHLDTELGERIIKLSRYYTANDIVLETNEKDIIYLKLVLKKGTTQSTFSYRIQTEFAKSVDDIIENYIIVVAFMDFLFIEDKNGISWEFDLINKTKQYFRNSLNYFKKVQQLEKDFEIKFDVSLHNDEKNDEQEVEELYGLLYEKMAFRYNAKLTSKGGIDIVPNPEEYKIDVGDKICLTFQNNLKYYIYGQTISIYAACLLINALVNSVEEIENGHKNIIYSDTDSEPMYISYTAFKTEEECKYELNNMMECKQKYIKSLTVEEYIWKIRNYSDTL